MSTQQMLLGVGAKSKTYVDELFNTYLYTGSSGSSQTFNNGIDFTKGGMLWIKNRGSTYGQQIFDTTRGVNKRLRGDLGNAEDTVSDSVTAFNNNGFTIGTSGEVSDNNTNHASWSFRKEPGFFDVVTWTGNDTNGRTIAHSLGSKPGMIIIKNLTDGEDWAVYHHNLKATHSLMLQSTSAKVDSAYHFNDTEPTASVFSLGTEDKVNKNGSNYIAYLFAGGESTASTARSVQFDGSSSEVHLSMSANTDLDMGTGDFTIEFWYKNHDSGVRQAIIASNTTWQSGFTQIQVSHVSHQNHIVLWDYDINSSAPVIKSTNSFPSNGTWRHVALTRSGSTLRLFVNGLLEKSETQAGSLDFSDGNGTLIGYNPSDIGLTGDISNLRVVKGTAVYTSSFRPPTAPLTNITNTKLLCCNNSHVAGKTVGPALTVTGSPTASTDSPFDDPAGYIFGPSGDQNIVKCGTYRGNGSSTGPEIFLEFEPQWILVKSADSTEHWEIYDSMRGIVTGAAEPCLEANLNNAESENDRFSLTPTGFKIVTSSGSVNSNGTNYIYLCIRRPDGYVGKPAKLGTDVFAMDTGDGNPSDLPSMDSNFPVDFGTIKLFASSQGWYTGSRLSGSNVMFTDTDAAESSSSILEWDSNKGFWKNLQSTYHGWMWKRHAGFDVVSFVSQGGSGTSFKHNLGKVPEMMWFKNRTRASQDWFVYHKGLDSSNPEKYRLKLNEYDAKAGPVNDFFEYTGSAGITATTASGGGFHETGGGSGDTMLCLLFASVNGISKVGSYVGSNSEQTITLGFEPRFLIFKNIDTTNWWEIRDTGRGWATSSGGTSQAIYPSETNAQGNDTAIHKTSTGFVMAGNIAGSNQSGSNYIYYAHA